MVCLTEKFPLVDLFTFNRDLADLVLEDYPGLIFQEQYEADKSEPEITQYCFYDLFPVTLRLFLQEYGIENCKCLYHLRDSRKGKPVSLDRT